jgi:DNA-directed RNA polymerase subunit RPC12/RpoP
MEQASGTRGATIVNQLSLFDERPDQPQRPPAQRELFVVDRSEPETQPKPRTKPRVLMHVIDAGDCGGCGERESDVRMKCGRCGHETDWTRLLDSVAKRGIPCPKCNRERQS